MMWFFYAFLASVLWGIAYVFGGRLLQSIHVQTLLLLELGIGTLTFLIWSLHKHTLGTDITTVLKDGTLSKQLVLSIVSFNVANLLIILSVREKNAVLASVLEVSYPLFVVLFSWLFFRESHMNLRTAAGGLMILAGVFIVYWNNR